MTLAEESSDVIRLNNRGPEGPPEREDPSGHLDGIRRGFDYLTFEARLESLWFQRKALMADGRETETKRQDEQIRAFCTEEGVRRLEYMSAALISETSFLLQRGRHSAALQSLELAEFFDPGRPQIRTARAKVYWAAGRGPFAAAGEWVAGLRGAITQSVADFSMVNRLGLLLVVSVMGCVAVFAVLMLVRHNVAFRHEIEEWIDHAVGDRWARIAGWAVLGAPLLVWVGAGWGAVFWIVILFRYMNRSERITAAVLLLAGALSVPGYRMAVGFYGVTADPLVRATLSSADGEYNPDRVIKLQRLVDANPEEPTYRFLLAGLFRNGRYFEDAFQEYKAVLRLDASHAKALINIGNIFYITGQHPEAIANYRSALDIEPGNVLALFNLHMAQSELFRFKDAEASLMEARMIDPGRVAAMLGEAGESGNRTSVQDAGLDIASIWDAALVGRSRDEGFRKAGWLEQSLNPVTVAFVAAMLIAGVMAMTSRRSEPARPCIRCGRPFCHYCKSSRSGREYCSQCLHIFVLGDGLAPEAKRKKVFEIERLENRIRAFRRALGAILPGSAQVLRGGAGRGTLLLLGWLTAILISWPRVLMPLEWLLGIDLRLDLLNTGPVPAIYVLSPPAIIGGTLLFAIWMFANARQIRRGEA